MKSLACLLLLVAALPVTAQQIEIIGFNHTGTLTWSNTAPLYCGIETRWNMKHTWLPLQDWNLHTTTPVTNTTIALADLWNQMEMITQLVLFDLDFDGLYFRIVASPSHLGPRYATNQIQITNTSTSVLVNVEIGVVASWSHNPITSWPSLAQGASTPLVSVAQEILPPGSGSIASVVNLGELVTQDGWYVSYDHDGSNRLFESVVLAFGEPEKNILVTVSNASVTVRFEWFRFQQTFPY